MGKAHVLGTTLMPFSDGKPLYQKVSNDVKITDAWSPWKSVAFYSLHINIHKFLQKQHFHWFLLKMTCLFEKTVLNHLRHRWKTWRFFEYWFEEQHVKVFRFFPTNWNKNFNVLTFGYRVLKTSTKMLLISAYPSFAILSCLEATPQTNYEGKAFFFG